MSKSDTWPGHVASESLSNMDSAGSCDSVISMNSGYSEDSMEHLSPEERACLMYLQETIEALEVQDDSGLSNEEPELGSFGDKMEQIRVNDVNASTSSQSEGHKNSLLGYEPPTTLPLPEAEPADIIESKTENDLLNHTPEPELASVPAPDTMDLKAIDLMTNASPPTPEVPSSLPVGNEAVIPPPSGFMDVPDSPLKPEKVKLHLPSVGTSKPGATVDVEQLRQRAITPTVNLEQLRQRAALRKTSLTPSPPEEYLSKPPLDLPSSLGLSSVNSSPPVSPLSEPKTPPAVAPKPKRLPANILLKSLKTAAPPSEANSVLSTPTNNDRMYFDHQKTRMEALRKLGLLKSHEEDSLTSTSPRLSPQNRRSWATPSPPASPASSNTPPMTPSYTRVNSPSLASARQHVAPAALSHSAASSAPHIPPPDILPAPAAFSDCTDSLPSDHEVSPVIDVPDSVVSRVTPSALIKQLSPPKAKAATLERGLGLSSYMEGENSSEFSEEQVPGQRRNSRSRPASVGSRIEFSAARGEDAHSDRGSSPGADMWTKPPTPTPPSNSDDSLKLPRSQGVSVLISPRADNEEDRREALKKLGLLRD
ncbi:specifically androgen-regulated gene protein [Salarias fasciatus]|uniref:Specifically androgen-regulated gene protein-like n=1 Tax=Salarias fasciatus TaxID=181472 RepID=A0A672J3V4_SALFA|nr:specifically androgen-regulated gene protein-like [Salarias fasciatus]